MGLLASLGRRLRDMATSVDPGLLEAEGLLNKAKLPCARVYHVDYLFGIPHRVFYVDSKQTARHVVLRIDDGQAVVVLSAGEGWPA